MLHILVEIILFFGCRLIYNNKKPTTSTKKGTHYNKSHVFVAIKK
jgi:hypothetical protein